MNHKEKIKLAKTMRTRIEMKEGISIFASKNWNDRRTAIEERVKKVQALQRKLSLKKKEQYATARLSH